MKLQFGFVSTFASRINPLICENALKISINFETFCEIMDIGTFFQPV